MEIQGICPIAPMVYEGSGTLGLEEYRHCCVKLLQSGAKSLCLFGNWEDVSRLDGREEGVLLEATGRLCGEAGASLVAWNWRRSTETAVSWAQAMESAGASGMVLSVPSGPFGAESLLEHIRTVSGAVGIPVLLAVTGELMAQIGIQRLGDELGQLPQVTGVVVMDRFGTGLASQLLLALPHECHVFLGAPSGESLAAYHSGCAGIFTLASLAPAHGKIWTALEEGNFAEAQRVHDNVSRLENMLDRSAALQIQVDKMLLERRGLIKSATCRKPLAMTEPMTDLLLEQAIRQLEEDLKD